MALTTVEVLAVKRHRHPSIHLFSDASDAFRGNSLSRDAQITLCLTVSSTKAFKARATISSSSPGSAPRPPHGTDLY